MDADQVTAVLLAWLTLTLNCNVPEEESVAAAGETETLTAALPLDGGGAGDFADCIGVHETERSRINSGKSTTARSARPPSLGSGEKAPLEVIARIRPNSFAGMAYVLRCHDCKERHGYRLGIPRPREDGRVSISARP